MPQMKPILWFFHYFLALLSVVIFTVSGFFKKTNMITSVSPTMTHNKHSWKW